jgi:hypothetical protein
VECTKSALGVYAPEDFLRPVSFSTRLALPRQSTSETPHAARRHRLHRAFRNGGKPSAWNDEHAFTDSGNPRAARALCPVARIGQTSVDGSTAKVLSTWIAARR